MGGAVKAITSPANILGSVASKIPVVGPIVGPAASYFAPGGGLGAAFGTAFGNAITGNNPGFPSGGGGVGGVGGVGGEYNPYHGPIPNMMANHKFNLPRIGVFSQPQQSSGGLFDQQPLQQYNQQNNPSTSLVSPIPLQPVQSGPYNPQPLQNFQNMLQGQPFNQNQVYAGGTPNFDESTGTYINPQQPKPMPLPGRRIIDPPRPVYGQRPQRGPVPRDITPVTLQQGLGGLGALPITNKQIG